MCCMLILMLGGCVTNSVTTMIQHSSNVKPQLPTAAVVGNELKGCSFAIGRVYFDIPNDDPELRLNIPSADIVALLEQRLRHAFSNANLNAGRTPAFVVNVAVVELRLKQNSRFQHPKFRVRMEVARPNQTLVMSGEFQADGRIDLTLNNTPSVHVPWKTIPLVALSEMLPATAVVITKTTLGLQEGKTTDEINIYPMSWLNIPIGGEIFPPSEYLRNHPFGIYPLGRVDLNGIADHMITPN